MKNIKYLSFVAMVFLLSTSMTYAAEGPMSDAELAKVMAEMDLKADSRLKQPQQPKGAVGSHLKRTAEDKTKDFRDKQAANKAERAVKREQAKQRIR